MTFKGKGRVKTTRGLKAGVFALCLLLMCVFLPFSVKAAEKIISFQGKLTKTADHTNLDDGFYDIIFKIYNSPQGGDVVWQEIWDGSTSKVYVESGVFSVKLGTFSSFDNLDFSNGNFYLTLNVNAGNGYDGEMSPRKQFTFSPFALVANGVSGDGKIDTQFRSAKYPAAQIAYNPTTTSEQSALLVSASSNVLAPTVKIIPGGSGGVLIGSNNITGSNIAYIGANPDAFSGNFLDFQIAGNSKFSISASGAITTVGSIIAGQNGAFVVSQNGNLSKINNISYNFPASQGISGSVLTNDGSGNLAWAPAGSGQSGWSRTTGIVKLSFVGDNVAIGADSANTKLTVTTSSQSYGISHTDSNITIASFVGNKISGSTGGFLGTKSQHPFMLYAGDGPASLTVAVGGNVGVGTQNPQNLFSVGGLSGFQVDSQGNIVKVRGVPYSFPVSQGPAGSVLSNDGNGNLTWTQISQSSAPSLTSKPADESVFNTTVFKTDSDLKFAMAPKTAYIVELFAQYTSGKNSDFKYGFNAPSDTKMRIYADSWTSATSPSTCNITSSATTCVNLSSITQDWNVLARGIVEAGPTGGIFSFRWGQNSAYAEDTTVKQNSTLRYTQLAEAADLAEIYYTEDTEMQAGDVVSIDTKIPNGVSKSQALEEEKLLGIISTKPALLIGEAQNQGLPVAVALAGRVPVKVNLENGPIKAGDYLSLSKKPGEAMKAKFGQAVIAQALEDFNETSGTVKAFISKSPGMFKRYYPAASPGEPALNMSDLEKAIIKEGILFEEVVMFGGGIKTDSISAIGDAINLLGTVYFEQAYFSRDTAGFAVIKTGQNKITINFEKAYKYLPAISASLNINQEQNIESVANLIFNDDVRFMVSEKSTEGFSIVLNKPAPYDINFGWIALAAKDPKIFYNPNQGAAENLNSISTIINKDTEKISEKREGEVLGTNDTENKPHLEENTVPSDPEGASGSSLDTPAPETAAPVENPTDLQE